MLNEYDFVKKEHYPDVLDCLLQEKFRRRHRVLIDGNKGVFTATDKNMFAGLQLLYYSLTLSHEIQFAVMDLGLTELQVKWCQDNNIPLVRMPEKLLLTDKTTYYWQTWNKPLWLESSPFQETLWLDSDIIVRGSLAHPFNVVSKNPFIVECISPPQINANKEGVYNFSRKMYVKQRTKLFPQAGVFGFSLERDRDLIDAWKFAVRKTNDHPILQSQFSWFDQGALVWALESTSKTDLVRTGEIAYNYPSWQISHKYKFNNIVEFLKFLPRYDCAAVRHFTTRIKPWTNWNEEIPIDLSDSTDKKMKILVLGHSKYKFEKEDNRSYLEYISLNEIELGEHQKNELAESRIFLDPKLLDRFKDVEYVGLASEQWNKKYGFSLLIESLHEFRDQLAKDVVLVIDPTPINPPWTKDVVEKNQGIETMLKELAEFTKIPLAKGPSFWANNFICHKIILEKYLTHFQKVYNHFWNKYQNRFPFKGVDEKRTPAYFYECVTIQYFSNQVDLKIIKMVNKTKI